MDNFAMKRGLCDVAERLGCWNGHSSNIQQKFMNDAEFKESCSSVNFKLYIVCSDIDSLY